MAERPEQIPEGPNKAFTLCKSPIQVAQALFEIQRPQYEGIAGAALLFKVTAAGSGTTPPGLSPLCACCGQKAIDFGEAHFGNYQALLSKIIKIAGRVDMLNHMSGSRGDTPLMKACAVGNDLIVRMLLAQGVRDPHLGFIIPPF